MFNHNRRRSTDLFGNLAADVMERERAASILASRTISGTLMTALVFAMCLSCASCTKSSTTPSENSAAATKPLPVQVAKTELKHVRREIAAVGSLLPYEEVAVSAEVDGKVDRVHVDVGDHVTAGQPLVSILPVELKLSFEQQRAALQQVRARLGLRNGLDQLKDVRDAADVKKAAADLNDAEKKYLRAKSLMEAGLLPREGFDEAEARYGAARAAYDLAVQTVENLIAQMGEYQATMALAEKKLSDTVIRAPFVGQVRERTVTQGQYLKVQTPVMVIVNTNPLRARLKVPEKVARWVKAGQLVSITVEAYTDRTFTGKITRINPSVEQQTRSFDVEALIDNNEGLLKPGFFVKASIPSDLVENTLFIPQEALYYSYGVYKVYTLNRDTLTEREVKIGERTEKEVEILSGVTADDRIAVPTKGLVLKDRAVVTVIE